MPIKGDPASSHRLSIVEVALEGVFARLRDHMNTPEKIALAARAFACDKELERWRREPLSDEERRTLVGNVMDIATEVMKLPPKGTGGT